MQGFNQAVQLLRSDDRDIPALSPPNDYRFTVVNHMIEKLLEVCACLRVRPFDRHAASKLYRSIVRYFATPITSRRTGTSSFTITRRLCGTMTPKSGRWILKLLVAWRRPSGMSTTRTGIVIRLTTPWSVRSPVTLMSVG